jgi:pyruvate/oxaloacetate carboxyltransferase
MNIGAVSASERRKRIAHGFKPWVAGQNGKSPAGAAEEHIENRK